MLQAYFVYRITHLFNQKSYIGITNNPKRRFNEHRYAARIGSMYPIHAAMRKHGINQFEFEILFGSRDQKYIHEEMEKHFIIQYDSKKHGYNCTDGGEGIQGYTPEWIDKMRVAGTQISKETRHKRSEAAKQQWADKEKRKATHTALIAAAQDPERRKGNAERAKARWADPAFRAKMQAKYATPEQREKKRNASLARWAITTS